LFYLPGGLTGFLPLHIVLFSWVLWGFDQVARLRRLGLWCSVVLASAGIFALTVHGMLLLQGGVEFRVPVSILLPIAIGAVSIAQLAVATRGLRACPPI